MSYVYGRSLCVCFIIVCLLGVAVVACRVACGAACGMAFGMEWLMCALVWYQYVVRLGGIFEIVPF